MNWIKYFLTSFMIVITIIILIFLGDLVAKKYLGLGEPIVYNSHPLWGYSPRENRKYTRFDGDIVTINEIGVRASQEWRTDGANIVFFGDSVTYGGSYIDDSQTFASLVCKNISEWSCYNAGVNGYGILNIVAKSRYDSPINDAPLRVFTFISGDFDRGLQNSNSAHFILRDPPKYFSGIWEIMNFVSASINPKNWFGKQSDIQDPKILNQAQLINRKFALDIFINELERLKSLDHHFLIVHSPSIAEIKNPNILTNNFVLSTLEERFPENYLSLADTIKSNFEIDGHLIYKDNVHFEELGHEIVADTLSPIISNLINKSNISIKFNKN